MQNYRSVDDFNVGFQRQEDALMADEIQTKPLIKYFEIFAFAVVAHMIVASFFASLLYNIITYATSLVILGSLLYYRERERLSFILRTSLVFLEKVSFQDRLWHEQRNVECIENVDPSELGFDEKFHTYAITMDDGKTTYYLAPMRLEDEPRDKVRVDSPAGPVDSMGIQLWTAIVGANYDEDSGEIQPVKQIMFSPSMARMADQHDHHLHSFEVDLSADAAPPIDIFDEVSPDMLKKLRESVVKPLMDSLLIKKDSEQPIHGMYHSRSTDALGWAQLDILPPEPDIEEIPATVGYRCYNCNATLKDTTTITDFHFTCEYCGSLNKVTSRSTELKK